MDRISQLPDELLLKLLSLLPTSKHFVATMVLSKRWKFLWMFTPRLVYDDHSYQKAEYERFSRFIEKSLSLHKASVIETLHFKLNQDCNKVDNQAWITVAEKHCVRELIIEIDASSTSAKFPVSIFPGSLTTCCTMLTTLKLSNATLLDINSPISFPSLKKLSLESVQYGHTEFFNKILSSCPVLEDLVVEQCEDDYMTIISIRLPTLKSLVLHRFESKVKNQSHGFVIDAPSLECLDIFHACGHCVIETNMTKIVKANIVTHIPHPWKKLGSVTSFKRLYVCLPSSKDVYPAGSIFSSLVHLTICTCETEWVNLLMLVLRDSPNLRALKLKQSHFLRSEDPRPCWNPRWNERSSVPECFLSSLVTFEWVFYEGATEEKEVVAFILRSASLLKKATIHVSSISEDRDKKVEVIKELFSSSRRSPACQLEFC